MKSKFTFALVLLVFSGFYQSCTGTIESKLKEQFDDNTSSMQDISEASDHKLLQKYATACELELSTLKDEVIDIPEINCSSPELTPVDTLPELTVDGKPTGRCQNPSGLLGSYLSKENHGSDLCATGTKIGRKDLGDVTWITVCRKYAKHKNPTVFDDVNMIGYNRVTGKTCFFNSHVPGETSEKPLDFSKPVHVKRDSVDFFMSPNQIQKVAPCADCHSANAFLRTPHIRSADIIPEINKKTEYSIVMQEYFATHVNKETSTRVLETQVPSVKACTGCHAVGRGKYCKIYQKFAWGRLSSKYDYGNYLSAGAQTLPEMLWHSAAIPSLAKVSTAEALEQTKFSQTVLELAEWCAENDD